MQFFFKSTKMYKFTKLPKLKKIKLFFKSSAPVIILIKNFINKINIFFYKKIIQIKIYKRIIYKIFNTFLAL